MSKIPSSCAVACLAVILLVGINFTYHGTFALQWESVSPYTGEIVCGRLIVALITYLVICNQIFRWLKDQRNRVVPLTLSLLFIFYGMKPLFGGFVSSGTRLRPYAFDLSWQCQLTHDVCRTLARKATSGMPSGHMALMVGLSPYVSRGIYRNVHYATFFWVYIETYGVFHTGFQMLSGVLVGLTIIVATRRFGNVV